MICLRPTRRENTYAQDGTVRIFINTSVLFFALIFISGIAINPSSALAAKNTGGQTYASCMNGCWKSHTYCKKHQSKTMDCSKQLGICIDYCENTYDPQSKRPRTPRFLAPKQKLKAPTREDSKSKKKKMRNNTTIRR